MDLPHQWDRLAACRSIDPDLFFDKPSSSRAALTEACSSCPVVALCVANMLGANTRRSPALFGWWGGVNADHVTGKMLDYIQAIAASAVATNAGNEVAYLATRFLMECATTQVRDDGGGAISDDMFDRFVQSLRDTGLARLAAAIEEISTAPDKAVGSYSPAVIRQVLEGDQRASPAPRLSSPKR